MSFTPEIGTAGGQQYPVLRSIQTFLRQMGEGGARSAPAVLKELLQNADDAGATEMSIMLDEREPRAGLSAKYDPLMGPAFLVRNNAPFRVASEVGEEHDDFEAIRDVAGGHKRAQATAAGRFGIGFNSVYFLTDTPMLLSRREIHVFDLLHEIFTANGWRFSIDDFKRDSGFREGAVKEVIDWCFPAAGLLTHSIGTIANDPQEDYQQTVFRLPLRRTPEGAKALYDDRFPEARDRQELLSEMAETAAHCIHFLKNICRISFSILRGREAEPLVTVEATPSPNKFKAFLARVNQLAERDQVSEKEDCAFDRTITRRDFSKDGQESGCRAWRFHVRHVARFDDENLTRLRERLRLNEEKATPWAAIAVPLDVEACRLAGGEVAKWRVFLPLLDDGPCGCILNGAFFVGPSRQRVEYRLDKSEAQKRKTEWNQRLVERALTPLLHDISLELPELARELMEAHPKDYLNLFPLTRSDDEEATNLTEFARRCFSASAWALRLRDIWDEPFDLLVGDGGAETVVELVPEWLLAYAGQFRELSSERRRFVRYTLGEALSARVGPSQGITVRWNVSAEVARKVLLHPQAPKAEDLEKLLKLVIGDGGGHTGLEGAWAFQRQEAEELLRFEGGKLYVLEEPEADPVIKHLRGLGLGFENTEWVRADVGLTRLLSKLSPGLQNVVRPTADAGLELLRRLPATNEHDQVAHDYEIKPVIDFLVKQAPARVTSDLRLGFLVRTAHAQGERRVLGTLLLNPADPTAEDSAFWEVWFRRVFAHVDPDFGKELQRLLAAHPHSLGAFQASNCRVRLGCARDAFEILHAVRSMLPAVCDKLAKEIGDASQKHPVLTEQVAGLLLESADAGWDAMDAPQRYTLLALPIHRCSDGRFTALVAPTGVDADSIAREFRLQSQDDVEDAPIETPACRLLQTVNSTAKRFYRLRLGVKVQGRVEVLKDVLRQIGEPGRENEKMLRYLERYYEAALGGLDRSADASGQMDARELRELMTSARTVPCVDTAWFKASECTEAWQMADHLLAQGWAKKRLSSLLLQLLVGQHVASIDAEMRELLPRLHRLKAWDTRKIVELCITSGSSGLNLAERVKLFWDNRRDFPETGAARSVAAGLLQVPGQAGAVMLSESEFFAGVAELPSRVMSAIASKAVALPVLAAQVGLKVEDVPSVLRAFQVPELTGKDLEDRLTERFNEVWPGIEDREERMRVLRYIHARGLSGRLAEAAEGLDTVLAGSRKPGWKMPATVISPTWAGTKPPHVMAESLPTLDKIPEAVLRVWDQWCGVRTFGDVFSLVVEKAAAAGMEKQSAAKAVYSWLERAVGASPNDEELKVLKARSWVLAQRSGELDFKAPAEVLVHAGEKVLGARFWVRAALQLPEFCRHGSESVGFATTLAATPRELEEAGECLALRAAGEQTAAMRVYELVAELLEQSEGLREHWERLAERRSVYLSFRDRARALTSLQIFVGGGEYKEDLSANLLCLKGTSRLPKGLIETYRRLGVTESPTVSQVLAALTAISPGEPGVGASYARVLGALQALAESGEVELNPVSLGAARVLTCARTYEPIKTCYWDEGLGSKGRVVAEHAGLIIDATDKPTRSLVEWLAERYPGVFSNLRSVAKVESADSALPVPVGSTVEDLLYPWRQWLRDVADPDSAIRNGLIELGASPPENEIEVIPVEKIRLRYRLAGGQVIEQSPSWEGPAALALPNGQLLFRSQALESGSGRGGDLVGEMDAAIAGEVGRLLGGTASDGSSGAVVEKILKTIERPSTVLRHLHDSNREHFLHQYYDQVADPKFARLFDEYRRTDPRRQRAQDLKSEMFEVLFAKFVQERAAQIRGYGYDEFSVFAELMQNAEDAYSQGEQLGMGTRDPFEVVYRYLEDGRGGRVLEVDHRGRPFNHGSRHDPNFGRDVEGVLRSAGSFKQHVGEGAAAQAGTSAIGRFGLGFKSVYLLTDCPEIHSGAWHFAIKAGCLPEELPRLADLPNDKTRLRLPLRSDVKVLDRAEKLLDLVPFLRMVTDVQFQPLGAGPATIQVEANVILKAESVTVEEVTIALKGIAREGLVRLLRCRSRGHEGQLALVLNDAGIPVRWHEAFEHDVYVALPLKAKLSCGVAVSHRFEVQSGRTHLVDPAKNAQRMDEVAGLLEGLVGGVLSRDRTVSPSELLRRFWALWRWNESDSECEYLAGALARTLARMAERKRVVPTLDPDKPAKLGDTLCVYFNQIPDAFRDALLDAGVRIGIREKPAQAIGCSEVVEAGFAAAYARTCAYAGVPQSPSLCGIGWAEVSKAFRDSPWFADKPELLNCLASALNQEQRMQAAKWVAVCEVGTSRREKGERRVPANLLESEFPGVELLPRRLIEYISERYDVGAIELLKLAGLRSQPCSSEVRTWMGAGDLTQAEAVGILKYLGEGRRFSKWYNDLEEFVRGAWIPAEGGPITVREAVRRGLIPDEVLADYLFKVWLGLLSSDDKEPEEEETEEPEPIDPDEALGKLFKWWQANGKWWTSAYESRLYGDGRRPRLEPYDERKSDDRRGWLVLFVIGCLHKVGRTRAEQHRGFIERCERNGWLDVFADGDRDAQRWMSVLDDYLDDPTEDERYRQWMRQFVDIYQISRWLTDYVESFRNIDRLGRQFGLDEILAPRTNADFSGGGPDAPSLRRTLGIGACFVVRELMRFGVLADARAHKYCYLPTRRVRALLGLMGCQSLEGEERAVQSAIIHSFLVKHLGAEKSTFLRSFDLPLQALAEDKQLQLVLLGQEVPCEEEDLIFRTHPSGHVYPIRV